MTSLASTSSVICWPRFIRPHQVKRHFSFLQVLGTKLFIASLIQTQPTPRAPATLSFVFVEAESSKAYFLVCITWKFPLFLLFSVSKLSGCCFFFICLWRRLDVLFTSLRQQHSLLLKGRSAFGKLCLKRVHHPLQFKHLQHFTS